jgi:hypothetical protein
MSKQNLPTWPKQTGFVPGNELDRVNKSTRLGRINISIDISSEIE